MVTLNHVGDDFLREGLKGANEGHRSRVGDDALREHPKGDNEGHQTLRSDRRRHHEKQLELQRVTQPRNVMSDAFCSV
jgi:hypothetical protein